MNQYSLEDRPAWPSATVSVRGPLLHVPRDQPAGQTQQYGVCLFLQVSSTKVVALINRRITGVNVGDFESGWDAVIFDDPSQINEENARPMVSNTSETHPRTGEPLVMVHHMPIGGFVPLGAKLENGQPHPHAGTGFGFAPILGYPTDNSVRVPHIAKDLHKYTALYQFAFDGEDFAITDMQPIGQDELLPGWFGSDRGLSVAIPDGEDLLFPMAAGRDDEVAREHAERLKVAGREPYRSAHPIVGECYGSGLSRWRRGKDGWRPISFKRVPKPGPDMSFEPSLVRDHDGSLIMAVRGIGTDVPPGESDCGLENTYEHLRVYRSADNGETWESVIHQPEHRAPTPVSIIRAADGNLFIAANPFRGIEHDSRGRLRQKIRQRDQLWLWQLDNDRRGVGEPAAILNCAEVLGPPRDTGQQSDDNEWFADHPIGGAFRLADGKVHTLVGIRVTDAATTSGGATTADPSGGWLAVLKTEGQGAIDWQF